MLTLYCWNIVMAASGVALLWQWRNRKAQRYMQLWWFLCLAVTTWCMLMHFFLRGESYGLGVVMLVSGLLICWTAAYQIDRLTGQHILRPPPSDQTAPEPPARTPAP